MENISKSQFEEVLEKIIELQTKINSIKKVPSITLIEESLSEIWDNEEDERWNHI